MNGMSKMFSQRKVIPALLKSTLDRFFGAAGREKTRAGTAPAGSRFLFESLEPRILLSADFTPVAPLGSFIQRVEQGDTAGHFAELGTTDYTLLLDAGQRISVLFEADAQLQGKIQIFGPAGGDPLGEVVAQQAGEKLLLDSLPVADSGDYLLRVENLAGSGNFNADVFLNASLESELLGGVSDNDLTGAQDLAPAWLDLPEGGQRAAVVGSVEPGTADFYRLELPADERLSLALTALDTGGGGALGLQLIDATGRSVAAGRRGAATSDQVVDGFAALAGTYYLRVSGSGGERYSLVALRQARMDVEPNDSALQAQPLSPLADVIGHLGGGSSALRIAVVSSMQPGFDGGLNAMVGQLNDDAQGRFAASLVAPLDIDTLGEMSSYDVVVVGGTGSGLSEFALYAGILEPYVFNGGGVVATGFSLLAAQSLSAEARAAIDAVLPVNASAWDNGQSYTSEVWVTPSGALHPINEGLGAFFVGSGPGDSSYVENPVALPPVDPDATVLATVQRGEEAPRAVAAAANRGFGHAVYLGPAYAFGFSPGSGLRSGDADRMLEQAVAWAAGDPLGAGDQYLIAANPGDHLVITTTTFGGAADDPADVRAPLNSLDPRLQLYSPGLASVEVASDDNGAFDGRNARIEYLVPDDAGGAYRLRVSSLSGSGDYTLHVAGATGTADVQAMDLVGVSVADGARLGAFPSAVDFTFSQAVRIDGLSPSDLSVSDGDGNPVEVLDALLVDAATVRFVLAAQSVHMHYSMTLAADVIHDLSNSVGNAGDTRQFDVDLQAPTVTWQSVNDGDRMLAGAFGFSIGFSEMMSSVGLGPEDVRLVDTLSGRSVAASLLDFQGDWVYLAFPELAEGAYRLSVLSQSTGFRDVAGNLLDGDSDGQAGGDRALVFGVDIDEAAYQTPLVRRAPAGSLVYGSAEPAREGALYEPWGEDYDTYFLDLDAGQRLSVGLYEVAPDLRARIEAFAPDGTQLGAYEATGAGEAVGLNNLPVDSAGRYRIVLSNLQDPAQGNWTSGHFKLDVLLNSAVELERAGWGTNNDAASAENLGATVIDLGDGAQRGAVLGNLSVQTLNVVAEQAFAGDPEAMWTLRTITGDPNPPSIDWNLGGSGQLTMNSSSNVDGAGNKYSVLQEAEWAVDLSGLTQATLSFREIGLDAVAERFATDEAGRFVGFSGHVNADGVALSQDGENWFPLVQLAAEYGDLWNTYSVDLDAAAAAAGWSLDGLFRIRFQYFDDPAALKYRSWDDVVITTESPLAVSSVFVQGEGGGYESQPSLLADGIVPVQGSDWNRSGNFWWWGQTFDPQNGNGLAVVLDLGAAREVADLLLSVDNNDDYAVDWSVDGETWNRLLAVAADLGDVGYGMDTISTVAGSEEYVDGVDFAGAVSARYLRVYASGGDDAYAVGEVRVLGAPGQRIGLDQDWYSFTLNDYESATLALHHQNPQSAGNVRMEIVDANGNLVASDLPGAGEVARVIANFVAHPGLGPSGTFYVRVFGAAPGDYNLVLTRNADFSLENGGDQAIGPSGRVLGAIVGGETDGFLLHLNGGDVVELWTRTPGSDANGEFVNGLDPRIEVFDLAGNPVALDFDNDNAWNGGNAWLGFAVPGSDPVDYRVVVRDAGETGGEYVLYSSGATGVAEGLHVVSVAPADGLSVAAYPNSLRLDFSAPLRVDHVNNWDLVIRDPNGDESVAQSVWMADADTVFFNIANAFDGVGEYTAILGGETMFDLSGRAVQYFASTFLFDDSSPKVVAASIAQDEVVGPGDLQVQIQFSEDLLASVLDASDVQLRNETSGALLSATGFVYDDQTRTLRLDFSGLSEGNYTLTLFSRNDAFRDAGGLLLDGEHSGSLPSGDSVPGGDFVLRFATDRVGPTAYPTPLVGIQPDGSLIYDPLATGVFYGTGDSDDYTLNLDAGQTLSVILSPQAAGVLGGIVVLAPDGSPLAEAVGLLDGQNVVVQTAPVTSAGTYTIRAISQAGGGAYQVQAFLNTRLEVEAGEDVQDLDGSFITLAGSAARGAARGSLRAGDVDWYGFSLSAGDSATLLLARDNRTQAANLTLDLYDAAGHWLASSLAGSVDVDRLIKNFTPAAGGVFHVRVSGDPASYSLLVLRNAQFDLEPNTLASQAMTLSLDGAGDGRVLGYLGNFVGAISSESEPNDTAANGGSAADLPLANDLNGSFSSIGGNQYRATVNGTISVGSDWDWDFFKVSLAAGDFLAINLNNAGVGDPFLHLYNSSGSRITYNDDYSGLNSYIGYTATYTGDYYVVADSYSNRTGGYQLIVTVTTPTPSFGDSRDQYLYAVNPGDVLIVETATPGDGAGEPVNLLDPQLFLYAPDGNLVALDQNGAADGRNARIEYTVSGAALAGALYRIEVRSENQTKGSYVLSARGSSATPPPFNVTTTTPADQALLAVYPATYTVDFSQALLLSSVDAADLTIDGIAASSVTVVDGDTLRFAIDQAAHGDAAYTVRIAAGALSSVSGQALGSFTATFETDATPPRVTVSSLLGGETLAPGSVVYSANFSEELASSGLGADDVLLVNLDTGVSIATSVSYVGGTLSASLGNLAEGNYRLTLVADADGFRDRRSNLLDGEYAGSLPSGDGVAGGNFVVDFKVDALGVTPLALSRVAPLGSLVNDAQVGSNLYAAADVDLFTIDLQAGQLASLRLTLENPALSAQIELLDANGDLVPGATTSGSGTLLLANLPITLAGTHTLRISGLAGAGNYVVQLLLNAQFEAETWGGAANDDLAAALSLDASAVGLQAAADRLAALGTITAGNADWYRFSLAAGQVASLAVTRTDQPGAGGLSLELYDLAGTRLALGIADAGNVDQAISQFVAPAAGEYAVRVSSAATLPYSLLVTRGAEIGLENPGVSEVQDIGPTLQAVGYLGASGSSEGSIRVAVLNSGAANQVVNQLNDDTWFNFIATSVTYTQIDTVAELAAYDVVMLGDSNTSHGQIAAIAPALRQWVEAGGGVVGTGWLIYSAGATTGVPVADIDAIIPVDTTIGYAYQTNASLLDLTVGDHPVSAGVSDFAPGYYVEYSSTVDAGASVLANSVGSAGTQPAVVVGDIGAGRGVYLGPLYMISAYGQLASGDADRLLEQAVAWAAGDHDDRYSIEVTAGQALDIRTTTPFDAPGEPVNTLDARLELYDPSGNLVASDDNGADGDERNANILYTAASSGRYEVRVIAASSAQANRGEYILKVNGSVLSPGQAPTVVASNPAEGANFLNPPTTLTLTLSEGLLATSVEAADLTLSNGAQVTGVTLVDGRTLRFSVSAPNVAGSFAYTLAAGAVQDLQGLGNVAYTGHFTVDHTGAHVVSQNPEAQASAPFSQMSFTFSEDLDPASVSVADIASFTGPSGNTITVNSVSVAGNVLTVNFAAQTQQGQYTMVLGPHIGDRVGNAMDQNQDGANGQTDDRYTAVVQLQSPDLQAISLSNPAAALWGDTIELIWRVENVGSDPARNNWYDAIYLSSDALLDGNDRRLYAAWASRNPLPADDGEVDDYSSTINLALPLDWDPIEGTYYLILRTDAFGHQPESNENNNTVAGQAIALRLPARPDLVVSNVSMPADLVLNPSGNTLVPITWTVTNQGTAAASGWYDWVQLSSDNVAGSDVHYGSFLFEGTLNPGESATRTQYIALPYNYVGNVSDVARWVVVTTDGANQHYEVRPGTPSSHPAGEANNARVSEQPMTVRYPALPNLQVTAVTPPDHSFSGGDTVISWTVTNTGVGASSVPTWYDAVFLSTDNVLDSSDLSLGVVGNPSYLAGSGNVGNSYTSSLHFLVPQGWSGPYYYLVKTDYYNHMFENQNEGDNVGSAAVVIELTPPPDLQVVARNPNNNEWESSVRVNAPGGLWSGQAATVSWTVTNRGDGTTAPAAQWYDCVYMSVDDSFSTDDIVLGTWWHNGALEAGAAYSRSESIVLPIGLPADGVPTTYHFFVVTDVGNQVYEYVSEGNNDNSYASEVVSLTPPPDLEPDAIDLPATAQAGHSFAFTYAVTNFGTLTPNAYWNDRFWLSTDNVLDASDLHLGDRGHWGALDTDQSYSASFTYTLPNGIAGEYRVIMRTDVQNHVFEGLDNPANNYYPEGNNQIVSDVMTIVSRPADLVIVPGSFVSSASAEAGRTISASWTVRNDGNGDSVENGWIDQLVASPDDVLGNGDDVPLYSHQHSGVLAAGAGYSVNNVSVALPITLATGEYRLFVRTDAGNQVFESDNGNNSAVNSLSVLRQTADLQVVTVSDLPAEATAGSSLSLSWRVQNLGLQPTNVNYWYDDVFLSADPELGAGDISLGSVRHNNVLAPGEWYDAEASFTLSTTITAGSYYVIVRTDQHNTVVESPSEANNIASSPARVAIAAWAGGERPLSELRPDLAVTSVSLPADAYSGQPFTLQWTVTNQSTTDNTGARYWYDSVYLSRDLFLERSSDLYLGHVLQYRDLAVGEHYDVTQAFTVPAGYTGQLYAFVVTDVTGSVTESVETNNATRSPGVVNVSLAPPANLVAGLITVPTNGVPGQAADITYRVSNAAGANAVVGSWKDTLYLSTDTLWDIGDAVIGSVWNTYAAADPFSGGEEYTQTLHAALPGVDPGEYHVIVRSDILNFVNETSDADNLSASLEAVALDAVVLPLGGSVSGELAYRQAAYYKLEVGAGETVQIRLDSAGSNVANELYVRFGSMPSLGRFDYASREAYDADPVVLIPETQAGTYYVLAYGADVSGAPAYTLSSAVIPFSLSEVRTDTVGNSGEATLRIDGARFSEATRFALRAPDGRLYDATRLFVEDSSRVYATFNLLLAAEGRYDVVAVQATGQTEVLNDAVTVIDDARGANLFSIIEGPRQVTIGRVNSFNLQYTNQGDGDSMAPLLIISSRSHVPIGYTGSDLRDQPIYYLGASIDGPMDILRPDTGYTQQLLYRSPMSEGQFDIRVATLQSTDSRLIDSAKWTEIEQSIKPLAPEGMSSNEWNAAWEVFWGRIRVTMGNTWGDYVRMLNQAMLLVSEQGSPVRDVRTLMATVYQQHPDWRPASNLSGTLRDAETGAALANVQLAAYRTTSQGLALGGYATTDINGRFTLSGLLPGNYSLGLASGVFDMNRNGLDDSGEVLGGAPLALPSFAVSFSADTAAGDVYVLDTTRVVHTDDSAPVLANAPDGTPNILWLRDGKAWHAWFDGSNWRDARAVSADGASDLNLVAAGNVLDGSDPGLIAVWQQNGGNDALGGNDSEIFYAVARPRAGGGYQWSAPIRLTNDVVADRGLEVVVIGSGQVLIVDKKENVAIQDDADVYYYVVDVATGALLWTATPTVLRPQASVAYSYDKEYGPWNALGMEVKATIGLHGEATQNECEASLTVGGGAELSLESDNLGITLEGHGDLEAEWGVDLAAHDWDFHQATAKIGISGELDWKNGLLKMLGAIPTPATKAAASFIEWATAAINKTGVVEASNGIKGSIGLDFSGLRWTIAEPFPEWIWPNVIAEAAVEASVKAYAGIQIKDDDDWKLEVEGGIVAEVDVYPSVQLTKLGGEIGITLTLWGIDFSPEPYFLGYEKSDLVPLDATGQQRPLYRQSWNSALLIGTGADYGNAVLADVGSDLYDDGSPALAHDAAGTYAAWTHNLGDIGSEVRVATYDGSAWSTPLAIAGSLGWNGSVNTMTDASGRRMVIWTRADTSSLNHNSDLDTLQAARAANEVMYSVFDGSSWSAPAVLAATAGQDGGITLSKDAAGKVIAGWISTDSAGIQHLLSASWNGSTWSAAQEIAAAATLGQLELGLVGSTLTAFWTEDVSAAGDSSETSMRSARYLGGVWSSASAFSPVLLSATLGASEVSATTGFSLNGSDVPLQAQTLAGVLFGPPPDECFKCKPEDIKKVTENAPNCRPGGGTDVQYDPEECIERTIIYQPCAVRPRDPNDILGPQGFGDENWITASATEAYTIRFENAADASAPAQQVVITQILDPDLDPRTFRPDDFGWGDFRQELTVNRLQYSGRVDLTASRGYYVDVVASVDVPTATITWTLTTIDPATGEMPADASIGFLPVNDTVYDENHQVVVEGTHRGEGFVSYTVRPKAGRPSGTRVDAQASIVFDTQAPIVTPTIFATLDSGRPSSQVAPLPASILPATGDATEFLVSWGGNDESAGSAIADYTIYVSVDGGAFSIWLLNTPSTEAIYTGHRGHTYAFYSTARDNAGNEEEAPADADTVTTIAGGSGSLSGVKYEDVNGDGVRGAGENGLAGWTIYLDANESGTLDAGEVSVVTDANGVYRFADLVAGNYLVGEEMRSGWMAINPAAGSRQITIVGGEESTADFGNFALAQIGGLKFNDLDGDGSQDEGEGGLAGWTIELDRGGDGTIDASATTDDYGYYRFTDLGPGVYRVSEVQREGWLQTAPSSGYYSVSPTSGADIGGNDFANVQAGSIAGRKFEDVNGDRRWNAEDDRGLAGWTIYLDRNANGVLESGERHTTTAADGSYRFDNLLPGTYTVAEVMQAGWVQTYPGVSPARTVSLTGSTAVLSLPDEFVRADVSADEVLSNTLAEHLTNLDAYRANADYAALNGAGVTTVVIDTGIDLNHSFFGPDTNADGIADRIVFQWDFAENDADASDRHGHGSNVSSLIASSDALARGVAPQADLIALKVFTDAGSGNFGDLEEALQWTLSHVDSYHIGVINMSLGDGENWADAASMYGIGDELAALAAHGVIIVAAAGNSYYEYSGQLGVAYPAADPAVVAAGAVWSGDFGGQYRYGSGAIDVSTGAGRIAAFSQRDDTQLDAFVPGTRMLGANATGGTVTMYGTSQASAYLAGIATLAQDVAQQYLHRNLTTGEFAALLASSGNTILDGDDENDNVANTGLSFSTLDMLALANAIRNLSTSGNGGGGGSTDDDPNVGLIAGPASHTVHVAAGEDIAERDFGNFRLGEISGTVFDDFDANGGYDPGISDSGLPEMTVFIDADGDGALDVDETSTTTGVGGAWRIAGVGPGTHRVTLLNPGGWTHTTANFFDVFMASGASETRDFGVNQIPYAGDDSFVGDEDQAMVIDLARGDNDPDGPQRVVQVLNAPSFGNLVELGGGVFSYSPTADFNGEDSFTYQVFDGLATSNVATVRLTINAVNDAPVAVGEAYAFDEDVALEVLPNGVLANDTDVDGDSLSVILVSGVAHGALTLSADGGFTYTPDANYNGSDSFSYKVNDGSADSNVVTVNLTIGAVNDAPLAIEDAYAVDEDNTLSVSAANGVLTNDSDVDGDSLSVILVSNVVHGVLVLDADGGFAYTPDANYNGSDSFIYRVSDGVTISNDITVSLSIRPVNDAPVARDNSYSVARNGTLAVVAEGGVLANDSDVEGDALVAELVSEPAHGQLVLNADGSFTYTPDVGYSGTDSFVYAAKDGVDTSTATVFLNVGGGNNAPLAVADAYTVDEDGSLTVAANGV
ncbi:MAG TPA: tandem-95 repeat protein, partial [Accumulibacter sp.]|uniref:tandem-95 repeat protein n=1 Tax=Accumulibacter sp. TaxID=2053492 RepID=UPI002C4CD420